MTTASSRIIVGTKLQNESASGKCLSLLPPTEYDLKLYKYMYVQKERVSDKKAPARSKSIRRAVG